MVGLPELAESCGGCCVYLGHFLESNTFDSKERLGGCAAILALPPGATEGSQVHFSTGASTMPRK